MGAGASTQLDSQLDNLVKEGLEQGAKEEDAGFLLRNLNVSYHNRDLC